MEYVCYFHFYALYSYEMMENGIVIYLLIELNLVGVHIFARFTTYMAAQNIKAEIGQQNLIGHWCFWMIYKKQNLWIKTLGQNLQSKSHLSCSN